MVTKVKVGQKLQYLGTTAQDGKDPCCTVEVYGYTMTAVEGSFNALEERLTGVVMRRIDGEMGYATPDQLLEIEDGSDGQ
jgi:hypothetical protein